MSLFALLLVLTGALCHALWNLAAKRAAGGAPFVWLCNSVSAVLAAPLGIWAICRSAAWPTTPMWLAMLGSAALHTAYSLVLQRGYREADFSVVYPVARGTGPLLSVFGAILLLAERPSGLGWLGIAAILGGILLIAGIGQGSRDARLSQGLLWGGLTGLFIAAYTVLDGYAIKTLLMSPLLFYVVGMAMRTVLLAPTVLRDRPSLQQQWRDNRGPVLIVGILSPLAYILVLFALQRAPLSYVAPVRELSMMIGVLLGARLFQEGQSLPRLAGTALMVAGVLALSLTH
ncbi:DMT family transporter [Chitinimonas sp.]|uniref:DMT family transporter n=1 Tax=Chitinimonas sp. TaxID=1934313 RepID=UPI0035AD78A1